MKKEKSKSLPRKQGRLFMLLWSLSYAALWMVLLSNMSLYSNPNAIRGPSVEAAGYVGIFIAAGLVAVMQQRLLRRPIIGWVVSGLLGTLLSFVIFSRTLGTPDTTMLTPSLALLVPTSLIQMIWLWRHVKSAWLWPLTNIVAAMSFAFLFRGSDASAMNAGLGLLQGIIQAVVMRYLWSQPLDTEKAHQHLKTAETDDRAAIQRLALSEPSDEMIEEVLLVQRQSR